MGKTRKNKTRKNKTRKNKTRGGILRRMMGFSKVQVAPAPSRSHFQSPAYDNYHSYTLDLFINSSKKFNQKPTSKTNYFDYFTEMCNTHSFNEQADIERPEENNMKVLCGILEGLNCHISKINAIHAFLFDIDLYNYKNIVPSNEDSESILRDNKEKIIIYLKNNLHQLRYEERLQRHYENKLQLCKRVLNSIMDFMVKL